MKIVTWNVNSIKMRLPRLLAMLQRHDVDVACLQELKCLDDQFPHLELQGLGYQAVLSCERQRNGVAIVSRLPLEDVQAGFPGNPAPEQARAVFATVDGVRIGSLYVVNGKTVGAPEHDLKLRWLDALGAWVREAHSPSDPLVLLGDYNVAPDDRDVHDPEEWRGENLASEPERERLRAMLDWGLVDLARLHHEGPGPFTWWDYRMGAFHRGWGLRIDLALGTEPVAKRCTAVEVDRTERKPTSGEGKPSDHAPVVVTLA